MSASVAIVGAGVAGLSAARALRSAGLTPVVFDKGRGPGGRISSRRAEPFSFDHGAQYFTVRDPEFRSAVEAWVESGVVAAWNPRLVSLSGAGVRPVSNGHERFVGTPRMSVVARQLAEGVDVRCGTRVGSLRRIEQQWHLADDCSESLGQFDRVLVTAPPAQARELLGSAWPLGDSAPVLRPCWAVLLGLDEPFAVDFDAAFCEDSSLSWIARNNSKPGRSPAEAWVLHASPEWSEISFDESPARVVERLTAEVARTTGVSLPARRYEAAHRWAYALPAAEGSTSCIHDAALGLALAGDAYAGGRVEGAFLSGLDAGRGLGL